MEAVQFSNDIKNLGIKDAFVTEKEVEDLKLNYLNSLAEVKEVTDENATVAQGHSVVINFAGTRSNGESPDNMKASEYLLEIGSGQFIPGFEEGIIGSKKGQTLDLKLNFPADYHMEDLRNEAVTFKVDILEIKERILPDFTDEMAKTIGFESISDFQEKTKARLLNQKEREAKTKLHQQVLEKFIAENPMTVPLSLVHEQEHHLFEEMKPMLKQQGFSEDMMEQYYDKWHDELHQKAEFQVKSGLILDKLAKDLGVEVSEADLDAKYTEIAAQSNMKKEDVEKYFKKEANAKKNLLYSAREEKTFAEVLKKITLA